MCFDSLSILQFVFKKETWKKVSFKTIYHMLFAISSICTTKYDAIWTRRHGNRELPIRCRKTIESKACMAGEKAGWWTGTGTTQLVKIGRSH
jgi:hypothetical protein